MAISNEAMESLLQAIDIIAEQRTKSNNSYNQTIICTITDNSNAEKYGYYTVTNDVITFDAYTENTTYKIGAQVRVTIPNGDYSQQKYIEGLYSYNNGEALTYIAPLDTFLDAAVLEDRRGSAAGLVTEPVYKLYANGNPNSVEDPNGIVVWGMNLADDPSYVKLQNNGIYDSIGIQADFKCMLDQYDVRQGSYGLRLDLDVKLNDSNQPVIHSLFLDSSTFFGNPYNFSVYSTQAQTYDISTIGTIVGATLYFYQDNNFAYYNGSTLEDIESSNYNLFVSNIYVALGSDLHKVPDNTVRLYTKDTMTYKCFNWTEQTNRKTLSVLWYNKDENDTYVGFSDGIYDKNGYDEIDYLERAAENSLLASQQSDSVINTRSALLASARFNEAIPLLDTVNSFIEVDIIRTLNRFHRQLHGCPGQSLVSDWTANIMNNLTQLKDNKKLFIEDMRARLNPAGTVTGSGYSATLLQLIAEMRKVVSDAAVNVEEKTIFNATEEIFAPGILELTENDYPTYQGIYDSFASKLVASFKTLKDYERQLKELIENIESLITSDPTQFISADFSEDAHKYSIYWYRYNPEYYDETEKFMTPGWEPILNEDGSKRISIGLPNEPDPETADPQYLIPKCKEEENLLTVDLDPYSKTEQFQVVICYNHEVYYSNILEFTNEDSFSDGMEFFDIDALYLEHGNQSHETYQTFYASNYGLSSAAEASRDREIKLCCKEEYGGLPQLSGAQLYWYIPTTATMLNYDIDQLVENYGFTIMKPNPEDSEVIGSEYYRDGFMCFYKQLSEYPKGDSSDERTEEQNTWLSNNFSFYYRIKDYHVPTSLRNTISCLIVRGDKQIEVSITMLFGTLGTCGTDYTLLIAPATNQTCVSSDFDYTDKNGENQTKDGAMPLLVGLYDYNNVKQEEVVFNLDWFGPTFYNANAIAEDEVGDYLIDGTPGCGIVRISTPFELVDVAEVDGEENNTLEKTRLVELSAFYPISWGARDGSLIGGTYYIEGATTVIYDSMGANPVYYKNPYKIYTSNHQEVPDVKWKIYWYDENGSAITADTEAYSFYKNYMPLLTSNNTLLPSNMYVNDCPCYPVVYASIVENGQDVIIWAQPIVILQNRYPSAMLSAWDGSLTIDEKNGTILSTMVGAGKKEMDNSFSGVLMGNVSVADINTGEDPIIGDNHSGLGIYGFHHGEQSFGLNVDGTAFLGKAGRGRISFDGNHGFIYSASWLNSFTQLQKNEDGKFLDVSGKTLDNISQDENGGLWITVDGKTYATIVDPTRGRFVYEVVAEDGTVTTKYSAKVLKSAFDFTYDNANNVIGVTVNEGTDGMAIDLQNGHIDAYNFRLSAGNLYLNSNPTEQPNKLDSRSNYYIQIGNDTTNGMLSLNHSGELVFKCIDFVLNAWNNDKGLYLSSSTELNGYYVKIGNETNHIYFGNDLKIAAQNFLLDAWSDSKGLYLDSNPINNKDYYLKLGNMNTNGNYITYQKDGTLIIKVFDLSIGNTDISDYINNHIEDADLIQLLQDKGLQGIYSSNGKYYISASLIQVLDSDKNILFLADGINKKVEIAGWNVSKGALEATSYGYIGLFSNCPYNISVNNSGNKNDWRILAGSKSSPKFGVDKYGDLYASNVTLSGNITATTLTANVSGTIGGWTIDSNYLKYGSSGLYSGSTSGVIGMLNTPTYVRFYAGLQSDNLLYKSNFYVTEAGELVAKYASLDNCIIGIDSTNCWHFERRGNSADTILTLPYEEEMVYETKYRYKIQLSSAGVTITEYLVNSNDIADDTIIKGPKTKSWMDIIGF